MLALGNEGDYLESIDDASLYFSHDGGKSWSRIKDGNCLYETTGRGSVLLVTYTNANYISYSLDEGNTWQDCIYFTNYTTLGDSIQPQSFQSNFDLNGANSLLLTLTQYNGSQQYELYSISFSDERICDSNDYEYWYPHGNSSSSQCLLGQQVQFLRKKITSDCIVGQDFQSEIITDCNCTIADYTCSYCYDYNYFNQTCQFSDFCQFYQAYPPPANCIGTYQTTPPYRRLAGSACINDVTSFLQPTIYPCPPYTTATSSSASTSSTPTTLSSTTPPIESVTNTGTNSSISTRDGVDANPIASDLSREPAIVITLIIFVILIGSLFITLILIYYFQFKVIN